MDTTTEKLTVELWCGDEGREALVRESHRSCVSGGLPTFASVVLNKLAEKLASEDAVERKAGFDALRSLGVIAERE